MPLYTNGQFSNGFNSGSNLFLAPDFFAPNATTGDLCWFELYPGHDTQTHDPVTGNLTRTATVNGGGQWYFASLPFVVKPKRPSGQVVTWREDGTERGKPVNKIFSNSTTNATASLTITAGSRPTNGGASQIALSSIRTLSGFGPTIAVLLLI